MNRPSYAAIAQAFYEEIEYNEEAFKPFACVGRPQLARIENRAREIDAEAKDVAGEAGPIVRYNDDGSLDEVVGTGEFHLEQMDHNYWWMRLGPHSVWLSAKGKITASIGLNEQRVASAPTAPNEGERHGS